MAEKVKPICISFKNDILKYINAYCNEYGCTRSWIVNKAVKNFVLEYLEDKEDYEIAKNALEEFNKGDKKTYTADEVFSRAGL